MMRKGLVELTKCRLREFAREPSAMIFVILMPIIWMIVIGFAFICSGSWLYGSSFRIWSSG